jgi:hypothetical protein
MGIGLDFIRIFCSDFLLIKVVDNVVEGVFFISFDKILNALGLKFLWSFWNQHLFKIKSILLIKIGILQDQVFESGQRLNYRV